MNAIEIENISKQFGKVKALDDVCLEVKEGECFGLIGPDGAGKTTLFRILTTLLSPDNGKASVNGFDVKRDYLEIRKCVGYMPGRFSLYQDLSVEENLEFFAALFNTKIKDSYSLIEPIYKQIEPFKTRRAGKLSGGMKQKLALSCALIHHPKVLFLDEPTTGVDAVSRSEFWDMLSELKAKGITILVSTPYMDEASRCERIALCNEGKILTTNTPKSIVDDYKEDLYAISADNMFELLTLSRKVEGVKECYPFGESHHLVVEKDFDKEYFANELNQIKNLQIKKASPSIEDMFIKLMKR